MGIVWISIIPGSSTTEPKTIQELRGELDLSALYEALWNRSLVDFIALQTEDG